MSEVRELLLVVFARTASSSHARPPRFILSPLRGVTGGRDLTVDRKQVPGVTATICHSPDASDMPLCQFVMTSMREVLRQKANFYCCLVY